MELLLIGLAVIASISVVGKLVPLPEPAMEEEREPEEETNLAPHPLSVWEKDEEEEDNEDDEEEDDDEFI